MPRKVVFQSLDFTCGPTCLLMALSKLRPDAVIDPIEEFLIWREANSIFMGHSHPGCTHYGLARAAIRRGLGVGIYSNKITSVDRIFDLAALKSSEKEVFRLVHRHDRAVAMNEGAVIHEKPLSPKLIARLLEKGNAVLSLVKSFVDAEEHWVVIKKVGEDMITLIDPYEKHLDHRHALEDIARATHRLSFREFRDYCEFGKDKAYVLLALFDVD